MNAADALNLRFGKRLSTILQTEAAECGLACLGMIAGYHGLETDMATLRGRFPISMKGATLDTLLNVAADLGLETNAVKISDLAFLQNLKLPCVLHWEFKHFVVLEQLHLDGATIRDPGFGVRRVSTQELSDAFTGVAVEVWPSPSFKPAVEKSKISIRGLVGSVHGIGRSAAQILILAMALEVFTLVAPFFLQWVIDDVLVTSDHDLLVTLAIGFALLMLAQQLFTAIRGWVLIYLGTTLSIQWRANVFAHMLRLPVSYFEKRHLGDVVSRFGSIDTIQRTLTSSFVESLIDGVMSAAILFLMFIYSPALALISVGFMVAYALGRWLMFRPLRAATDQQIIHSAKQQTHFLESVRGIKTIKLFQRNQERRARWLNLLTNQMNADVRIQKFTLLYRSTNGVLFGFENVLIIWLGASMVLEGQFSVGLLVAYMTYKSMFDTRVGGLIDKVTDVKMLHLQAERLADLVQHDPEIKPTGRGTVDANGLKASLKISGLHFRYAPHENDVLRGVELEVREGESVAIIGPSGGGKSTLINIILGIVLPTQGEILLGGVKLSELGIESVRSVIGTVLQDDVLFGGTIAENIGFFDPSLDQAWIEECAKRSAIHDDILAMPMGYNTLVGDMGTVLSGGQKQRVLLARALYKRPKILLLDEATSHLDVPRERLVTDSIKQMNITRVIVAHRPETIAAADRVVALVEGKIIDNVMARPAPQPLEVQQA
jgi:ATP-binding cassette subfamily B protein RaxB